MGVAAVGCHSASERTVVVDAAAVVDVVVAGVVAVGDAVVVGEEDVGEDDVGEEDAGEDVVEGSDVRSSC